MSPVKLFQKSLFFGLLLILCPCKAGAEELAPRKLELPEESYACTVFFNYKSRHLEERNYQRPALMVPVGITNLSKGKPVEASAAPIFGALQQITDGDKDYHKTSLVELPEGLQWAQVDLGEDREVFAVVTWRFHEFLYVCKDVVMQLSSDPEFKTNVTTLYNNDDDNSAGFGIGHDNEYVETNNGRVFDAKGIQARYIRCYGQGNSNNTFNHFIEVEVWGK